MTPKDINRLHFDGKNYYIVVSVSETEITLRRVDPVLTYNPDRANIKVPNNLPSPGTLHITVQVQQ